MCPLFVCTLSEYRAVTRAGGKRRHTRLTTGCFQPHSCAQFGHGEVISLLYTGRTVHILQQQQQR